MNSERIEQRFGSYGVEVVEHGPARRASSLYSLEDGRRVCRTFATVEFRLPIAPELAAEHERVATGESIGTVFKSAGWRVRKRHVRLRQRTLTENDRPVAALMHLEAPCTVAEHAYVFEVARRDQAFDYAAITELHHPDYLDLTELRSIYAEAPRA